MDEVDVTRVAAQASKVGQVEEADFRAWLYEHDSLGVSKSGD